MLSADERAECCGWSTREARRGARALLRRTIVPRPPTPCPLRPRLPNKTTGTLELAGMAWRVRTLRARDLRVRRVHHERTTAAGLAGLGHPGLLSSPREATRARGRGRASTHAHRYPLTQTREAQRGAGGSGADEHRRSTLDALRSTLYSLCNVLGLSASPPHCLRAPSGSPSGSTHGWTI